METRNITLDLATAKQWYESGSSFKRELALRAFTEKELTEPDWKKITTFEKACEALGIDPVGINLEMIGKSEQVKAIMQLDIIKKALNGNWNPSLNEGELYYSWCRWYPKGYSYPNNWSKVAEFKDLHNNKTYVLVGGGACGCYANGLGGLGCGFGFAFLGFLCCKSKEIAMHLTKYFGKIIFDAIYGQYRNYKWI